MAENFTELQNAITTSWYVEEDDGLNAAEGSSDDVEVEPPRVKRQRVNSGVSDVSSLDINHGSDKSKADNNEAVEVLTQSKSDSSTTTMGVNDKVLSAIAENLNMKEKMDGRVNEKLAEMVNTLMFKSKKPDEVKTKESIDKTLRPENCESLVVTKVDELIWNRLRPQMRSFDSRIQTAQRGLVKGIALVTKMLNSILELKTKISGTKGACEK